MRFVAPSLIARATLAMLGVLVGTGALTPSAGAQTAAASDPSIGDLLAESATLHPDVLAYAPFATAEVATLKQQLTDAVHRRDQAVAALVAAEGERLALSAALGTTIASQARWTFIEASRQAEAEAAADRLVALAISSFVSGDAQELELDAVLGHLDPMLRLNQAAEDTLYQQVIDAEAAQAEAHAEVVELRSRERALRLTMPVIDARWGDADRAKREAVVDIDRLTPALEAATVLSQINGVGCPAVVLDAYYRAALVTNERYPSCNVGWNQLAGIGQVETKHGTYGGSSVQADGSVVPHILGIVLDGSRSSAIRDTDGGALDGNTVWDRAVGPMQFIPSSWSIFRADGNGDGVADPHNLYDAAAAAGDHLCRRHSGLDNSEAFRTALLGYNRSQAYGTEDELCREVRASDLARWNAGDDRRHRSGRRRDRPDADRCWAERRPDP
ncbi:MAG: lytic transglycosylase domain-containing protein [Acidimicrobiales bacterium]